MKKIVALVLSASMLLTLVGCSEKVDYTGTFTGYSWKGEDKGVALKEAEQIIETKLTLDKKGVIEEANMLFYTQDKEGNWLTRQATDAEVAVDFSKNPTMATPEDGEQKYVAGESMFNIKTADMMSLYAVAVDEEGTAALAIVEPYTRYQFEFKMDKNFDFSTKMKDMTVGNGLAVPTIRTSSSGNIKPKTWDEYAENNVLNFYEDAYILTSKGIFEGLNQESTIKEFLECTGVTFEGNVPKAMDAKHGFTGVGGWSGNYAAIAENLVGKKATEVTSLVDWSDERYSAAINEDKFFGIDVPTGATKTVQNSHDGISGATVRMSRESTSYQRALVEAGIINEEDVIKGRF